MKYQLLPDKLVHVNGPFGTHLAIDPNGPDAVFIQIPDVPISRDSTYILKGYRIYREGGKVWHEDNE